MPEEIEVAKTSPAAKRARLTRFLKRGGVVVRDVVGGAIGTRWTKAALTGGDFDAVECERRMAEGRIVPVPGSHAAFWLPPPPPPR